jgi:hypothetical protein
MSKLSSAFLVGKTWAEADKRRDGSQYYIAHGCDNCNRGCKSFRGSGVHPDFDCSYVGQVTAMLRELKISDENIYRSGTVFSRSADPTYVSAMHIVTGEINPTTVSERITSIKRAFEKQKS